MHPVKKSFAVAAVSAVDSDNPNGEFEVILSTEAVDRDGEVIEARAFEPLPESIPFHVFHDFNDPIGRAEPFYDGNVLKARGYFASTARAQEIRTLVAEKVIGHTSVGFMAATRKDVNGTPHITKGELLEGSFTSIPSNRGAAVLAAKHHAESRQVVRKAHGMTANVLRDRLDQAVRLAHGGEDIHPWVRDYADTWVVFEIYSDEAGYALWRQSYSVTDSVVSLTGDREPVQAVTTYEPAQGSPIRTTAPAAPATDAGKSSGTPATVAGKSPASDVVEVDGSARAYVDTFRVLNDLD